MSLHFILKHGDTLFGDPVLRKHSHKCMVFKEIKVVVRIVAENDILRSQHKLCAYLENEHDIKKHLYMCRPSHGCLSPCYSAHY